MNGYLLGILTGGALIAGLAIAWAQWMHTRRELAEAKKKLHDLRVRWWVDLGNLAVAAGWVVAVVLILATIGFIAGGRSQ